MIPNWLVEKWDWFIYRRSIKSFRRMFKKNAGFVYLVELEIREMRKNKKPGEFNSELKEATEGFFDSMNNHHAIHISRPEDCKITGCFITELGEAR